MSEPVLLLPTKCIVDGRLRVREAPKLRSEITAQLHEAVLRVKMTGVVYHKDFELFRLKNFPRRPVVPGNKIVARLHAAAPGVSPGKFLVFPYSNCLHQRHRDACAHCQHLRDTKTDALTPQTMQYHREFACMYGWEYGVTLDGGLQDYIKVRLPLEALVRLPDTVSLHDCCFLLDIALPLYAWVREWQAAAGGAGAVLGDDADRILVVLNDAAREQNDVLIVLKHFGVARTRIHLVDADATAAAAAYKFCFLFSQTPRAVEVAIAALLTGLEATRARYHLVLFDQYNVQSVVAHRHLRHDHPDITVHHARLAFKDRVYAEELIAIWARLNAAEGDGLSRATSALLLALGSPRPAVRFVTPCKPPSWLWCERDVNLCPEHEDDGEGVRHINRLIRTHGRATRVCYTRRARPPAINAFLFR